VIQKIIVRGKEKNVDTEAKLTFGELKVGDRFIAFPLPGDNKGHGGYKGIHYICQKKQKLILLNYVTLCSGVEGHMPENAPVIKVR